MPKIIVYKISFTKEDLVSSTMNDIISEITRVVFRKIKVSDLSIEKFLVIICQGKQ